MGKSRWQVIVERGGAAFLLSHHLVSRSDQKTINSKYRKHPINSPLLKTSFFSILAVFCCSFMMWTAMK